MAESQARITSGGGGGGGGGGNPIPPPPQVDGPAWFIYNQSAVFGTTTQPNVNFDAVPNTVQGAMPIGTSRNATEVVYNVGKKTPLALTQIAIVGTDPGDFAIAPAALKAARNHPIPANRGQGAVLPLTFTPTAPGARTGTLRLVSNGRHGARLTFGHALRTGRSSLRRPAR